MKYNYKSEVKVAVADWFDDFVIFYSEGGEVKQVVIDGDTYDDRDVWEPEMIDRLLYDDLVTGGYTASYTGSPEKAKEYVMSNQDLVYEMIDHFMYSGTVVADWFFNEKWEEVDVQIRQYILGEVFYTILEKALTKHLFGTWLFDSTPEDEDYID